MASVVACGKSKPPASVASADKCPALTTADEVAAFDFAGAFGLPRDEADRLKAAILASFDLGKLAERLDADLGIACAQLAGDLGQTGDYRSGRVACEAAVKGLEQARARLGPHASAQLVAAEPICQTDMNAITKCASLCDSSIPKDGTKVECSVEVGRCDGDCAGVCEVKAARSCVGTCAGTCAGAIKGTCGGTCKGKCDGRRVHGACAGRCEGTCEGETSLGECKGKCMGTCDGAKPAVCDGACKGTCSVAFDGPKCAGELKLPNVNPACRALCELAALNQTACSTPRVGLVFNGKMSAQERQASDGTRAAIVKSLPGLLKVLDEVSADSGAERVMRVRSEIDAVRASFRSAHESKGGGETAASSPSGRQLAMCFDAGLKKAMAQAIDAKLAIDQAKTIRDDASR